MIKNQIVFVLISFGVFVQMVCTSADDTACIAAVATINFTCSAQLSNNYTPVCSGSCAPILAAANNTCASSTDTDAQTFIKAYNSVCGGGNCAAAGEALVASTYCSTLLETNENICLGTCTNLINDVIDACSYESNEAVTNLQNKLDALIRNCYSYSGCANNRSGILILLVVAINALLL